MEMTPEVIYFEHQGTLVGVITRGTKLHFIIDWHESGRHLRCRGFFRALFLWRRLYGLQSNRNRRRNDWRGALLALMIGFLGREGRVLHVGKARKRHAHRKRMV